MFDVTMGSYDGAEVCELVGLYILNTIALRYGKNQVGLYRDDGLAAFRNISGSRAERIKKDITKVFHDLGLKITIEANLKIVNFLDVTLDLIKGIYYPYRKPNNDPIFIDKLSNHPPTIIKHLPESISKRISAISHDKDVFDKAAPLYNNALKASGYSEVIEYCSDQTTQRTKQRRNRNIIWFNPPYSKNVQTNIGGIFLRLIRKHFPQSSALRQIFNKNTLKLSYSIMPNMSRIITSHNQEINQPRTQPHDSCNCRVKSKCPLDGKCQATGVVYTAQVTTTDNGTVKSYIGLTDSSFKTRYSNHLQSFAHRKHANNTRLSKYTWSIKDNNKPYTINWSILSRASAYSNTNKRCNLCLTEKLLISNANKSTLLNSRSELISKCRHQNKFCLENYFDPRLKWNNPRQLIRRPNQPSTNNNLSKSLKDKIS